MVFFYVFIYWNSNGFSSLCKTCGGVQSGCGFVDMTASGEGDGEESRGPSAHTGSTQSLVARGVRPRLYRKWTPPGQLTSTRKWAENGEQEGLDPILRTHMGAAEGAIPEAP